jgi:hypothetical protein
VLEDATEFRKSAGAASPEPLLRKRMPVWTTADEKEERMPIAQHDPALTRVVSQDQGVGELASGFGTDQGPAEGPLWWPVKAVHDA